MADTAASSTAPKVSVLVSAYNHEAYIEACLLSILNQTYKNIELIVIDDGSRDNTFAVVRKLAAQYGFYAEQQKNMGLTPTLNKALAMATGKYVCQFGSDDIMLPDKTAKQVAYLEAHPDVAVCGGNAILIDSQGKELEGRRDTAPEREVTFEKLFTSERNAGIIASTGMIRKSVLDKIGAWNPAIPLEDLYLWLKITSHGYRMVGFGEPLMYYRKHATNTYKNVRYMYESMMKIIADYKAHPLYAQVEIDLLRGYFLTAAKHDKQLAREILAHIPLARFNKKVLRGLFYLYFR